MNAKWQQKIIFSMISLIGSVSFAMSADEWMVLSVKDRYAIRETYTTAQRWDMWNKLTLDQKLSLSETNAAYDALLAGNLGKQVAGVPYSVNQWITKGAQERANLRASFNSIDLWNALTLVQKNAMRQTNASLENLNNLNNVIPNTCMGREIIYRDWDWNAQGDGTYFASQAPSRLGFTRHYGIMHIVRFKTDNNTYRGSVTATSDDVWSSGFVSKNPCAISNAFIDGSGRNGPHVSFVVATQSKFNQMLSAGHASSSDIRLEPNTYYYFHVLNALPGDLLLPNPAETCVDPYTGSPKPNCWYLAFESIYQHKLFAQDGTMITGNLIPGVSIDP